MSLVSPFELQVVSPLNPTASTDYADLQYAGVAYYQAGASPDLNNDLVLFGLSTWSNWSSLNDVSFNVCVDSNLDGVYDKVIYNANPSIFVSGASQTDNFVRIIRDTVTNGNTILGFGSDVNLVGPSFLDTTPDLSNVVVLGATPSQLGIASTATTSIRYKIVTCPGNSGCARTTTGDRCSPASSAYYDVAAGPYTWNWAAQGLNFGGNVLADDLNGSSLPVTWSTANMTANGSLGALLLHHHNKSGQRAEVLLLQGALSADLAIAKGFSPTNPTLGQNVTFTLTVTNNGPNDATGVVVSDYLPDGLTWVSDDSAGAYVPGTGLWTVGAVANGASAVLHVVATVETTSQSCNTATITSGTPLDPNAANNQSTVCVLAPRSADLALAMAASSPTTLAGTPVTFTLTVTNNGVDPAYALNVQESFPAFPALNPSSYTVSQGVYNPATGLWTFGSLGFGASATPHRDGQRTQHRGCVREPGDGLLHDQRPQQREQHRDRLDPGFVPGHDQRRDEVGHGPVLERRRSDLHRRPHEHGRHRPAGQPGPRVHRRSARCAAADGRVGHRRDGRGDGGHQHRDVGRRHSGPRLRDDHHPGRRRQRPGRRHRVEPGDGLLRRERRRHQRVDPPDRRPRHRRAHDVPCRRRGTGPGALDGGARRVRRRPRPRGLPRPEEAALLGPHPFTDETGPLPREGPRSLLVAR